MFKKISLVVVLVNLVACSSTPQHRETECKAYKNGGYKVCTTYEYNFAKRNPNDLFSGVKLSK